MYVSAVFALIVVVALAVMAPTIFNQYASNMAESSSSVITFVQAGAAVFGIVIVLVLFVATMVYWQNRWIVTDDSITQITQNSLFGRRVSQLSMENLEDITIDQNGIIQTMFNFGTLRAETAGERSKFVFQYCPDPKKYARAILEVHEAFIHQIRHQPQAINPVTPINGPTYEQQAQNGQQGQQQGQQLQDDAPAVPAQAPQPPQWGAPIPPAPQQQMPANQTQGQSQFGQPAAPEDQQNSQYQRPNLPPPLQ